MTFSAPFSRVITRPFGGVPTTGTALKTNLVAYWTLNESSDGSGAVSRLDSSGNNLTLGDYNTTPSASGLKGNCADLEYDNQEYLALKDRTENVMGNIDFTIAFWIKPESSRVQYLVSKGNETSAVSAYAYLSYLNSSNTLYWIVSAASADKSINIPSVINNGNWYFVVMYHDSVNDLIGAAINNGTHVTGSFNGGCVDYSYMVTNIGKKPQTTIDKYANGFDGMMDEIGIWKRMLTPAEITWLYNAGAGRTYSEF